MKFIVLLAVLASVAGPVRAGVLFVDLDATGGNDGSSWVDAYVDLQDALAAAAPADSIWVAEGEYRPTAGIDRSISFELKNGVELYGGFAGSETQLDERDWELNPTTLTGDLGVPLAPNLARELPRPDRTAPIFLHRLWFSTRLEALRSPGEADNSRSVVRADSTDATAVLDGFVVRDGYDWDGILPHGAGLSLTGASPTLRNLVIERNSSSGPGGGAAINGGAPKIVNCVFRENDTGYIGGGLHATGAATVVLDEVDFEDNFAQISGGAAWIGALPFMMTGGAVTDNSAQDAVAGIMCGGATQLTGVWFEANASFSGNGALSATGAIQLRSCRFIGNTTSFPSQAAAAGASLTATGAVENCVFAANEVLAAVPPTNPTRHWVGGLRASATVLIVQSTFAANAANHTGAFSHTGSDTARVHNSIVWGNSSTFGVAGVRTVQPDRMLIAHSDLQGSGGSTAWIASTGTDLGQNLDVDPLFVDAGTLDLRLQLGSPAVDGADALAVPFGLSLDVGGDPRLNGPGVDMGAYEFQGPTLDALFAASVHPATIDLRQNLDTVKLSLTPLWTVTAAEINAATVLVNGSLAPVPGSAALVGGRLDLLLKRSALVGTLGSGALVAVAVDAQLNGGLGFTAADSVRVIRERTIYHVQSAPLSARPNPFNPVTTIRYLVPEAGPADLIVYDLAGRRIRTLVRGHLPAGYSEVQWDGTDESGRRVSSGVYLCQLRAAQLRETRRLVLVK